MSNGQMQTRGLSAGDWVRLKRLRGARADGYSNGFTDGKLTDGSPNFNKDINPPGVPQIPYGRPIQVYRSVGTSKIRRPASDWTAFRASQTADFPTPSGQVVPFIESGTLQVMTKLCDCNPQPLVTKVAGCIKCRHDPIENYTRGGTQYIVINTEGAPCACSPSTVEQGCPGPVVLYPFNSPTTVVSITFTEGSFMGTVTNALVLVSPYIDLTGTTVTIDGIPADFFPLGPGAGALSGSYTTSSVIVFTFPTTITGLGAFCPDFSPG